MHWRSACCVVKSLFIFAVIVVSVCVLAYFLFSEGKEIFLIQFFLGVEISTLFLQLWSVCLGLAAAKCVCLCELAI